jgi:hypothetical protein
VVLVAGRRAVVLVGGRRAVVVMAERRAFVLVAERRAFVLVPGRRAVLRMSGWRTERAVVLSRRPGFAGMRETVGEARREVLLVAPREARGRRGRP